MIKTFKRVKKYSLTLLKDSEKDVIISTMRKSGSHYLLSLLGNYLINYFGDVESRIDINYLKEHFYQNSDFKNRTELTHKVINKIGRRAFIWEHENYLLNRKKKTKILVTIRNPLDTLLSRYYYNIKNRNNKLSIEEYFRNEIVRFSKHYLYLKKISLQNNVCLITYENLIKNTALTLQHILTFLEIPVNFRILKLAIKYSSKEELKKEEKRMNVNNLVIDVNVSFIRNGGIGEWQNDEILMNNFDVQSLINLLNSQNINLTEYEIN